MSEFVNPKIFGDITLKGRRVGDTIYPLEEGLLEVATRFSEGDIGLVEVAEILTNIEEGLVETAELISNLETAILEIAQILGGE